MRIVSRVNDLLNSRNGSINIADKQVIQSFISNPDFPWLISFPRTGSHWLRMMMELYFEKPSLVRVFYFKQKKDFTCYHRHDDNLDLHDIRRVIYIYRNPVDTVFSLNSYYREDIDDENNIIHRTHQYSDHLAKWLLHEEFTKQKVVLTYEGLKTDLFNEFKKLTDFFGEAFSYKKLEEVKSKVSKNGLKEKTADNKQIVNISTNYEIMRDSFKDKRSDLIFSKLFDKNPELEKLFP